jgi:hypothetical protein
MNDEPFPIPDNVFCTVGVDVADGCVTMAVHVDDLRAAFHTLHERWHARGWTVDAFLFTREQWQCIRVALNVESPRGVQAAFYLSGIPVYVAEDETRLASMYIDLALRDGKHVALLEDMAPRGQVTSPAEDGKTWRDRPPLL